MISSAVAAAATSFVSMVAMVFEPPPFPVLPVKLGRRPWAAEDERDPIGA
jgi:hypothetical protein